MPQPLRTITKGRQIAFTTDLPLHDPELCAKAMRVISSWSQLDAAILRAVTTLFPGRASTISSLYVGLKADSPKAAAVTALSLAAMNEEELETFAALQKRYKAAYKQRNPLAHWVIAHSVDLPGRLIAINGKDLITYFATLEDFFSPSDEGIYPQSDMLQDAQVYDEAELDTISRHINYTAALFFRFTGYLQWRVKGVFAEKRRQILAELRHDLGLPVSKANPSAEKDSA